MKLGTPQCPRQVSTDTDTAMHRIQTLVVETALVSAQQSWANLIQMGNHYVSGTLIGYEPLSRQAHLASCDLKTLSQSMDWACFGEPELILRLAEAGMNVFDRAMDNEQANATGALARSQVYFDDLLDADDLSALNVMVQRPTAESPDTPKQLVE